MMKIGIRSVWLLFLLQLVLLAVPSCGKGDLTPIISAAEVANEVARRGEVLYGVSVETCDAAERVAVEAPDVATAERAVQTIRARCDEVFRAFDRLRMALVRLDELVARIGQAGIGARDVADAAYLARTLHDQARDANDRLTEFLGTWLKG